jgi:anthranilate synthase component 1
MSSPPETPNFAEKYRALRPFAVATTLSADATTAVAIMAKIVERAAGECFLMEWVERGVARSRYTLVGLMPDLIWRCRNGRAETSRRDAGRADEFIPCADAPLTSLRATIAASRMALPASLPAASVGLFGYLSYDAARYMYDVPNTNPDVLGIPDGVFMRPGIVLVFDHATDMVTVVTPVWPDAGTSPDQAAQRTRRNIDMALDLMRAPAAATAVPSPSGARSGSIRTNMSAEEFRDNFARVSRKIPAGDVSQVGISLRFTRPISAPPFAIYRALRQLNPSPFMFYFDLVDFTIFGASPRLMVSVAGDRVTIRPIGGTRPRGASPEADRQNAQDLLGSDKETTEHLMNFDVGYRDMEKVAKRDSIKITEKMQLEYFSHVIHLVSTIEGVLDDKHDVVDALAAAFPAGTVVGSPKNRAMAVIDELEKERRSIYGGSVGYFAADGSMENYIAIRTALVRDGLMHVQAGAGIVADSDPAAEYQEIQHKAGALFRAADNAERGVPPTTSGL